MKTTPASKNVVHYCTNDLATLSCGASLDGDRLRKGAIVKQVGGKGLYRKFD